MRTQDDDAMKKDLVYILDYGAGNVRSVRNAIKYLGYSIREIETPDQILALPKEAKIIFPGVGNFYLAAKFLTEKKFAEPLKKYISQNRDFLGICVGMQCLFEGSTEDGHFQGLGVIPGIVENFRENVEFPTNLSVPHIGWNNLEVLKTTDLLKGIDPGHRAYFVHSFAVQPTLENESWIVAKTHYGKDFISVVGKGNVYATQFHPEKSGTVGLQILANFLNSATDLKCFLKPTAALSLPKGLCKRIIACMDVRRDEVGSLVVTKGVSYNVLDSKTNKIRNFGSPVDLAKKYFLQGCDELTFLGITTFKESVMSDSPLHQLLEKVSEEVFVPLTIGGGIRDYVNSETGETISALQVADKYFRSGADKVSIGSEAVRAVQKYLTNNKTKDGSSCFETISKKYGRQAVVLSVDPKRIYIKSKEEEDDHRLKGRHVLQILDRHGTRVPCIYLSTISGGKKITDLCAFELVKSAEELGAGEILLNCLDTDGQGTGFDIDLISAVKKQTRLPIIGSGGAGCAEHFDVEAGLASGIFHREEVTIREVKDKIIQNNLPARLNNSVFRP